MEFTYLEPQSLDEAIDMLAEHRSSGKLIANGTDLINQMRLHVKTPDVVIDLGYIPGLDSVKINDHGDLTLGAMATGRTVERHELVRRLFPVISRCAAHLGSKAIRNRATVGGNLCNASPAADSPPGFLVHEAILTAVGPAGQRTIPITEFFTGPGQTALEHGEILTTITVPEPPIGYSGYFLKHSIKGTSDLSFVCVAGLVTATEGQFRDTRIALGAVGPVPMRARNAEATLLDQPVTDELIERASSIAAAECSPIDDLRCSAEYRRELIRVYVRKVINLALGRSDMPLADEPGWRQG